MDERFGDLRSLLQQRASRFAWEELCQRITAYPSPERERAVLPYVTAHLSSWEDHRRVLTRAWRADALGRCPPQHLDLVRAIVVPPNDTPGLDAMARIFTREFMRLVTHVDLVSMRGIPVTEALLASRTLEHLSVLRVSAPVDAASIGADPRLDGLVELEVRGTNMPPTDVRRMLTRRSRAHLTSLCLAGNVFRTPHIRALEDAHTFLPSLKRLDLSQMDLHDDAVRLLAELPLLSELRALFVDTRTLTAHAAQALATSEHLPEPLRAVWAKRAARLPR
ncbi:MAG: hypothetical protein AAGI01_03480 [Myxococcota bacterium]